MVSFSVVEQSNADFKANVPSQVAFFVGATSGIGMNTLLRYAQYANAPTVYLVGRSDAKLSPVIKNLENINPLGSYKGIKSEISLLKSVDSACDEFKKHEKKLDLLFIGGGYLKVTRVGTSMSPYLSPFVPLTHIHPHRQPRRPRRHHVAPILRPSPLHA